MKTYLIVLLSIATLAAKAQSGPFTGIWKRNDTKTDAGGLSINTVAQKLEISADNAHLFVKATLGNAKGEVHVTTDTLNLDGTERVQPGNNQRRKRSSLEWSADKKQLTTTVTILDAQGTIVQNWQQIYKIAEDHILDIRLALAYNDQDFTLHETFDKQ